MENKNFVLTTANATMKEVRVIGSDGEQLGVMDINNAFHAAETQSMDLVVVSANAVPIVCRIMDYNKYRYEQSKKQKEMKRKQKTQETKEIQLTCAIDKHDLDVKIAHTAQFLRDKNKVRIVVKFRGREITRSDRGEALLRMFEEQCKEFGQPSKPSALEGHNLILLLMPK